MSESQNGPPFNPVESKRTVHTYLHYGWGLRREMRETEGAPVSVTILAFRDLETGEVYEFLMVDELKAQFVAALTGGIVLPS